MNPATVTVIHWMSQISLYVLIHVSTYLDFNADFSPGGSPIPGEGLVLSLPV